ncbi:M20 family metallopeptidase [Pusillimonas sp. SM2304]|uniref:M20 family metallopeptidase n=1 Tax=Pusillimonas sp. SM2304 TaxID=3073241 RepID=UPI002874016C|nr:M20 family metallopeptidase [Pusillimonas sp. SM2304]MDS1140440.1 M20 family metallopeptidase [Pusillimonas sp. SM2304]
MHATFAPSSPADPHSRKGCISHAIAYFEQGGLLRDLRRRIAYQSESDQGELPPALAAYLQDEMGPYLTAMGFSVQMLPNPIDGGGPFLVARRIEDVSLPTVLLYGHGDVVSGAPSSWRAGLDPWRVVVEGERWYGRGTADNKGQHSISLASLQAAINARGGSLGYNVTVLLESGEEAGSPGLLEFCDKHRDLLSADLFIGCDGPRISIDQPTLFLGSRGMVNFTLSLDCREGAFHSGNWGGVLRNPATVLANAIATMINAQGVMLVDGLHAPAISPEIRNAVSNLPIAGGSNDPALDEGWGEPGLTPPERLIAWNTMEVLALASGNGTRPVNAIPPRAVAHCQLRFVVGTQWERLEELIRDHLQLHGFQDVKIKVSMATAATRLDLSNPWVPWCVNSLRLTTSQPIAVMPNLAGSIPNAAFSEVLGLPTLWIPHSYPACGQHGPNEHLLAPIARQGLEMMAGLYWDLGEPGSPW